MTFYPDLGNETQAAAGVVIRAVGWLHADHPYPRGDVPAAFVDRLQQFADHWAESTQTLGLPMFLGWHDCELCSGGPRGSGNFGVPAGDVLFVAPELIVHYVQAHGYAPPRAFIDAVMASPLPGTQEYQAAVAKFLPALQRHVEEL
jgi:hypothetical protein